jgi:hypothetical protein
MDRNTDGINRGEQSFICENNLTGKNPRKKDW